MRRQTSARTNATEGRDPTLVGEAVGRLIADRGWEDHVALGRLQAFWSEIVGENVAVRSEPVRLESGRLTIRVEGGAWAAELAMLGPTLATAAARFLGAGRVREVAVVGGRLRHA